MGSLERYSMSNISTVLDLKVVLYLSLSVITNNSGYFIIDSKKLQQDRIPCVGGRSGNPSTKSGPLSYIITVTILKRVTDRGAAPLKPQPVG